MTEQPNSQSGDIGPIFVDLDCTLSRSDTLSDLFARVVLLRPLAALFAVFLLLRGGRPAFKDALSRHLDLLDTTVLPYNKEVMGFVERARRAGRSTYLVTAAHERIAARVAETTNLFTGYAGSTAKANLKGRSKLERIHEMSNSQFTYIGDSHADVPIWRVASSIGVVGRTSTLRRHIQLIGQTPVFISELAEASAIDWVKQLRLHQWSKNALVFLPMVLAQAFSLGNIMVTVAGFLAFSIMASMTYIVNDLADLNNDRAHPTKRNRPIAAGRIGATLALGIAVATMIIVFAAALIFSRSFAAVILIYLAISLAYSFKLKRVPLLDVLVIGLLFSVRLGAGAILLDIELSNWLVAFSLCLFPSLALAKRQGELVRAIKAGNNRVPGRGYETSDAILTLIFGISSTVASVLVLLLYVSSDAFAKYGLYTNPDYLWFAPATLAIWAGRIWLLAHRGILEDDPVAFSIRDPFSIAVGSSLLVVFCLAAWGGSF